MMDWELGKENVQPMKTGRNVEVLSDSLKAKAEGPARSRIFEYQRRQFQQAIEIYAGDDPLTPWIGYIKWVKDAFPAGGAQSELLKTLEKCMKLFQKDERYRRDKRYLHIWVQYADCCSDPIDIFAFLEANDIGQDYALFYEAYATSLEVRRKFTKAEEIYSLGLQRSAQPVGRLEAMYRSFLNRMMRRSERKNIEEQSTVLVGHDENDVPLRSFGATGVSSDSGATIGQQAQRDNSSRRPPVPTAHQRAPLNMHGPFLDNQEEVPPPITLGSVKNQPEKSKNACTQGSSTLRSRPDLVFGYDTTILSKDGTEQTFEEFRWSIWNDKRRLAHLEMRESSSLAGRDDTGKKDEDLTTSRLPIIYQKVEVPRTMESSHELGSSGDGKASPGSSAAAPMLSEVDGKIKDVVIPGANILSPISHQGGASGGVIVTSNHTAYADVQLGKTMITKGEEASSGFQSQPQVLALAAHPPPEQMSAVVDLSRLNSFITQGEETIAIKRFAEEVIVLGSDPKATSAASVSHQGLVEPTITTKEALADILDMFNKPLDCDQPQPKTRKPKDMMKPLNVPTVNSTGFQIFADEDLETRSPVKSKQNKNRPQALFRKQPAEPVGLFHIFENENLAPPVPADAYKNGQAISEHSHRKAQSSGFHSYQNKDMDTLLPENAERRLHKKSKAFTGEALVDTAFQSAGSESLVVDDSDLGRIRHPSTLQKEPPPTANSSSLFQVFVDEDFGLEAPVQRSEGSRIQTSSESFLHKSICVHNDMQELPEGSGNLHGKIFRTESLNAGIPEKSSELEACAHDEACKLKDDTHRRASSAGEMGEPLEINIQEVCIQDSSTLRQRKGRGSSKSSISGIVGNLCDQEVNVATVQTAVSPWDEENLQSLLAKLKPKIARFKGYFESAQKYSGPVSLSSLKSNNVRNKMLQLGSHTYRLKGSIGQGSFAQVFEVEDEVDDLLGIAAKLALKLQKPACLWEFYIYRQLDVRVSRENRRYYGRAQRFHLYSDCSFMICDHGDKGTLQDVVNAYLAKGQRMDEVLCTFYTIQMLRMLEVLHGAGIIHGDFKPDNLLIRDDDSDDELESRTSAGGLGFSESKGLCLIDFGRSIDMSLHPEGTEFKGDSKTDSFRCPEMYENLPWTFQAQEVILKACDWAAFVAPSASNVSVLIILQVDTFGLCGVVHCLLHGTYMQIEKVKRAKDAKPVYRPTSIYRRYWNVELWRRFFETLINIDNPQDKAILIELRGAFENYLRENSLGKKLKGLLAKQTIMMFTR